VGAWLLLPAALAGLWIARARRDLWPVFAFLLGSALAIVPFFLFERFRLHVVAACAPFAALAGVRMLQHLRARRFVPVAIGVACTIVVGSALALARAPRDPVVLRVNLGEMLFQAGRYEEALREFEAVRVASPEAWRVDINIANAEAARGRVEEALAALGRVLPRLEDEALRTGLPSDEEIGWCRELAGDLEMERGRPQEAAVHYAAALPHVATTRRAEMTAKLEAARSASLTPRR
jgi:tetratricopeptide (TPR) repeat protein